MSYISMLSWAIGVTVVLAIMLLVRLVWYKNKPWRMPKWFTNLCWLTICLTISYWLVTLTWYFYHVR